MLDYAANRIRRRLAEAADRSVGHRLRQFFQQCGVPLRLTQQTDGFCRSDAARRALPARFVGEELHQIERGIARAVVLRQDNDGRGSDEAVVGLQGIEIERNVAQASGKHAARSAAG